MSARVFASLVGLSTLAIFAACSDDETTTTVSPGTDDGGTTPDAPVETGPVVVGSNEVKQSGKTVRALATDTAVPSTITIAGKTVTTNADGTYEIAVPKGTPYQMNVNGGADYYKLIEQEWSVDQDLPNGDTQMLPVSLANLLAGALDPPRDPAKGLLVVSVRPEAPCTSEEGTTLTIDPPGSAKVAYFNGSFPSPDQTSVKKGASFSAFFYDVDPGVTVKVTATSPTCQQLPFPIAKDGKTFTGNQKTEPGESLSFMRVYLGPLK
jgi:hypothetical protein